MFSLYPTPIFSFFSHSLPRPTGYSHSFAVSQILLSQNYMFVDGEPSIDMSPPQKCICTCDDLTSDLLTSKSSSLTTRKL